MVKMAAGRHLIQLGSTQKFPQCKIEHFKGTETAYRTRGEAGGWCVQSGAAPRTVVFSATTPRDAGAR